jgi:RNA polymerase sigma factor (sigma-70 family)
LKPAIKYSDKELFEGMVKADPRVLKFIYTENFPSIRQYVLLNKGNEDDAKDIFQDSMVILYKKIKRPGFELTSSLGTFLYSICRFVWLKELSSRKVHAIIENEDKNKELISDEKGIIELIERNERLGLYKEKFEELSDDCKRVLKMFLNKIPIKDITKAMGYSSDQHTKNRRFRCKKSLIDKIKKSNKFNELGNEKNRND